MREQPENRGSSALLMRHDGDLRRFGNSQRTYSPDRNPKSSIFGENHNYPKQRVHFKSAWSIGASDRCLAATGGGI